jgi:hypothetical protein
MKIKFMYKSSNKNGCCYGIFLVRELLGMKFNREIRFLILIYDAISIIYTLLKREDSPLYFMDCHEFYQLIFKVVATLHRTKLITTEEKGFLKGINIFPSIIDEIVKGNISSLIQNILKTTDKSREG